MTFKVFLLDDHEVVRAGLRGLLEQSEEINVVGEASTADEALRRVPALAPDVAVLDVRLPDGDGVEVCRELRSRMPDLRCLMLTSFADDDALFAAIMGGASGYLLKQIKGNDLVEAIIKVGHGESLIDPALAGKVLQRLREGPAQDERLSRLSEQERRVLDLLAEGLTNRQIAERLYLAEKTVKNYVSNLLAKLNMSRRSEAAAFAARISERESKDHKRS